MESVLQSKSSEVRDLIDELIYFIQTEVEVMNRGLDNLWVIPINETVEKIKMGHAPIII